MHLTVSKAATGLTMEPVQSIMTQMSTPRCLNTRAAFFWATWRSSSVAPAALPACDAWWKQRAGELRGG